MRRYSKRQKAQPPPPEGQNRYTAISVIEAVLTTSTIATGERKPEKEGKAA